MYDNIRIKFRLYVKNEYTSCMNKKEIYVGYYPIRIHDSYILLRSFKQRTCTLQHYYQVVLLWVDESNKFH